MSLKRKISEVEENDCLPRSPTHRRVDDHGSSSFINIRIAYSALQPRHIPAFQLPFQLITFSYSPSRVLEFNNSAMRYYTNPPLNADLNYAYDTWIKRPEERGRLDGLLRACMRNEVKLERLRANVISWRGVLTKILVAPYEERETWDLNVMLINGTLYFEEHRSDIKLGEHENMSQRHRLQTYYGYAFESYCTSSTPDPKHDHERLTNGWSGNVNTNVQWCSVVKTKLGDSRLIIGGEVDCIEDRYTGQPNTFVELKTSLTIRGPQDEARFEKKLLKFYFQSFLLGVPEIKVGFRTPAGQLRNLQTFKTVQLPRLVRGKPGAWDPNVCLEWGDRFLSNIKKFIHDWDYGSLKDDVDKAECVWRVRFLPHSGAEITLLDDDGVNEVRNDEDRVGFLPRWYWDFIHSLPNTLEGQV